MSVALIRSLLTQPLLIEPHAGALFASVFAQRAGGARFDGAALHAALEVAMPRPARAEGGGGTVAIIALDGVISQHAQSLGTSCDELRARYDRALGDPQIDAIVFNGESPGGTVPGVPELADYIFATRGVKPTAAIANGMVASAAYWIAAACGELWVTASGDGAGSIGVYTMHTDYSKALEQEGIVMTGISAGKYKTEGAPWLPLSADAEAFLRARVDEVYGWFTKSVGKYRGATAAAVKSGYGEGRVLGGKHAVDAGLADRVGTLEELVQKLASKKPKASGARVSLLRQKLALDESR